MWHPCGKTTIYHFTLHWFHWLWISNFFLLWISDSDFTDNFLLTFSKEGCVTDLNDFIDTVTATCYLWQSPSRLRADSITFICDKVGVTSSHLPITTSTSVSVLKKFPAWTPFKCPLQHRIVTNNIPIPVRPLHNSKVDNLFRLWSFNEHGCKFP